MIRVPMFDYLKQYETLRDDITLAIERVLNSGRLILGEEVDHFESEFAEFLGGGGNCVGVGSGTDALVVALMALGIGYGDEVITVSNTAVPTVSAIRQVGAVPVFCDIDSHTCLMDIDKLPQHITSKTRAIIPVHLFGNVVDIEEIYKIIGKRSLCIIEDCAQAHGALIRGKMAGTMGDIGAFSFYPTKNLGAYGDAGVCYSKNVNIVAEMRKIRLYGFNNGYYSVREGINSRLDELQAAILRVKLNHLPEYIKQRRILAGRYISNLSEKIESIKPGLEVEHAYHLFVVKVTNRDEIRKALSQHGIETGIHYPSPIHLMSGYRFLGYKKDSLPITEMLAKSILSIPLFPELSGETVDRVCMELNDVIAQ